MEPQCVENYFDSMYSNLFTENDSPLKCNRSVISKAQSPFINHFIHQIECLLTPTNDNAGTNIHSITRWYCDDYKQQYVIDYKDNLFLIHLCFLSEYVVSQDVRIIRTMISNTSENTLLISPLYNLRPTLDAFTSKPLQDCFRSSDSLLKVIFWSGYGEEEDMRVDLDCYLHGIVVRLTNLREFSVESYIFNEITLGYGLLSAESGMIFYDLSVTVKFTYSMMEEEVNFKVLSNTKLT